MPTNPLFSVALTTEQTVRCLFPREIEKKMKFLTRPVGTCSNSYSLQQKLGRLLGYFQPALQNSVWGRQQAAISAPILLRAQVTQPRHQAACVKS